MMVNPNFNESAYIYYNAYDPTIWHFCCRKILRLWHNRRNVLDTVDVDIGDDTITYEIVGGSDDFEIVGNEIRVKSRGGHQF